MWTSTNGLIARETFIRITISAAWPHHRCLLELFPTILYPCEMGSSKGGTRGRWKVLHPSPVEEGGGSHDYHQYHSGQQYYTHHKPHHYVDPVLMRRGYVLLHFQFILRHDFAIWSTPGVPSTTTSANGTTAGVPVSTGGVLTTAGRRVVDALRDPDMQLHWDAVHSVVVRSSPDDFECPICMEFPTAPRFLECGHVFCLPCMLHLIAAHREAAAAAGDRNGANRGVPCCPVCHVPVCPATFRPVVYVPMELHVEVGKCLTMDLYRRERGSCVLRRCDDPVVIGLKTSAFTAREKEEEVETMLPSIDEPSLAMHSRYLHSSPSWCATQELVEEMGLEERVKGMAALPRPLSLADALEEKYLVAALAEVRKIHSLPQSLARNSPYHGPRAAPSSSTTNTNTNTTAAAPYMELYADSQGRPFFLHMLNMKMLKRDLEHRRRKGHSDGDGEDSEQPLELPPQISAKLVEVQTMEQSSDRRRIYKAFFHVPMHATIQLCLLDLSHLLLPKTIEEFRAEWEAAAAQRDKRQRLEARAHELQQQQRQERSSHYPASRGTATTNGGQPTSSPYSSYYGGGGGGTAGGGSPEPAFSASAASGPMPVLWLPSAATSVSSGGKPEDPLETRQRATKGVVAAGADPTPVVAGGGGLFGGLEGLGQGSGAAAPATANQGVWARGRATLMAGGDGGAAAAGGANGSSWRALACQKAGPTTGAARVVSAYAAADRAAPAAGVLSAEWLENDKNRAEEYIHHQQQEQQKAGDHPTTTTTSAAQDLNGHSNPTTTKKKKQVFQKKRRA